MFPHRHARPAQRLAYACLARSGQSRYVSRSHSVDVAQPQYYLLCRRQPSDNCHHVFQHIVGGVGHCHAALFLRQRNGDRSPSSDAVHTQVPDNGARQGSHRLRSSPRIIHSFARVSCAASSARLSLPSMRAAVATSIGRSSPASCSNSSVVIQCLGSVSFFAVSASRCERCSRPSW